ncbi:MAG: hypothetical protein ACFCU2_09490 [Acidimicrobiia bacterium]
MDIVTASGIIRDARRSVEAGEGLGGTGFWKLVGAIKKEPGLDRFVDDVAEIDQKAFKNWAFLTVPLALGTALMIFGTVVGLGLVTLAYQVEGVWSGVWILAGTGVLLVSTHGLAHLAVGTAVGIKFTYWFIGKISQPQPGVKTDYSTYLRTPPRSRAWMHAAGATTTKLIPFLMVGAALPAGVPTWATWALVAGGVVTVITDLLWSTKASDWKKFQREMAFAQES